MCYSGLRWLHAHKIIRNKTPTADWVTKVVLSFGINDRTCASTGWVGEWIRKSVSAAEVTFPNAQVLIPIINFNRNVPRDQIMNLSKINDHIISTKKTISLLPLPTISHRIGPYSLDKDYRSGNVGALAHSFKLRGEGHPVNQGGETVVNLSRTRILDKFEMSLLQRGLSFIPKGAGMGGAT